MDRKHNTTPQPIWTGNLYIPKEHPEVQGRVVVHYQRLSGARLDKVEPPELEGAIADQSPLDEKAAAGTEPTVDPHKHKHTQVASGLSGAGV